MTPEGYWERRRKIFFPDEISEIMESKKQIFTIQKQIDIANEKRLEAVKKENYLEAAKYRDIITSLKK